MKTNSPSRVQQKETKDTKGLRQRRHLVPFVGFWSTLLLSLATTSAATRYVWQDSPSPAPPYDTWANAAHVIQDAVDAAQTGEAVLVAGGVYTTGGRAVGTNQLVNRVAIDRAITVESLMGSEVTIIQGYQVPGTTNGDGAIRCVYLADGASLSGFTLTNGATGIDRGYYLDRSGGGLRCESTNALVSNCMVIGNSASYYGGGAYSGTLNHCTLTSNSAAVGGGADDSTLNNCVLTGNSAQRGGGGEFCTLNNCTVTGNSAESGGGAADSVLNHCTVTGNSAEFGGGVYGDDFSECRVTNCIVYFNSAVVGPNHFMTVLDSSCTTPLPEYDTGNIALDPQLASASHLSATSPCRGAGNPGGVTGTDIDGDAWASPPSIGCDEYRVGAVTGPLSVKIVATYTNVAVGFPVEFTALIDGQTGASAWDFGDKVVVSNRPYASHAWAAPGDYAVALRAYNESLPGGMTASVTVHVVTPPVQYVNAGGTNPVPPYASWAMAATNIQDAVDAAMVPGALVLVSNGVYATGGRAVHGTMTNRLAVDNPVTVRSVNGPEFTVIQGYQVPGTTNGDGAIRCVYLTSGASLSGFTLTNGATRTAGDRRETYGGGVWCESANTVVSNCVLAGNSAGSGGGASGGGAYYGTLNNCTLTGNSAWSGGGAYGSTLNNCTLVGNSATVAGGGACFGTLSDCTLAGNSASDSGGGTGRSTLNNCALVGNSADDGGGAYDGTLYDCTLTGNSAKNAGGGTCFSTLLNCTLAGNSATSYGGGAANGPLNNCIVYFNTAPSGANYAGAYLNYCCTTPMPAPNFGQMGPTVGNMTNPPLFVDYAGGNLRLQSNSPCIDAGKNAYVTSPTDLDGNPRIIGGTVDIGAYENTDGATINGVPWAWLLQYGLPTDGSADTIDADADGHTTWQEWRCQTDPTNALSALRLLSAIPSGTNVTVTWQSVPGVSYFLERSTNVAGPPPVFTPLATHIPGQPDTTSFTDTNAVSSTPLFYRVGVGK